MSDIEAWREDIRKHQQRCLNVIQELKSFKSATNQRMKQANISPTQRQELESESRETDKEIVETQQIYDGFSKLLDEWKGGNELYA